MAIIPASRRVVLRVGQRFEITSTSGAFAERLFALNDIFDPENTGGSAQAVGLASWSAFYNQYRVRSCKVCIYAKSNVDADAMALSMGASNLTTAFSSVSLMAAQQGVLGFAAGFSSRCVLRRTYDIDKFYANYGTAPSDVSSTVGASPSDLLLLHVGAESVSGGTASALCYALLEFVVDFFAPRQVS